MLFNPPNPQTLPPPSPSFPLIGGSLLLAALRPSSCTFLLGVQGCCDAYVVTGASSGSALEEYMGTYIRVRGYTNEDRPVYYDRAGHYLSYTLEERTRWQFLPDRIGSETCGAGCNYRDIMSFESILTSTLCPEEVAGWVERDDFTETDIAVTCAGEPTLPPSRTVSARLASTA